MNTKKKKIVRYTVCLDSIQHFNLVDSSGVKHRLTADTIATETDDTARTNFALHIFGMSCLIYMNTTVAVIAVTATFYSLVWPIGILLMHLI